MQSLRVLTYNVWDTPIVSPLRTERVEAMCNRFRRGKFEYDVLAFQEVFSAATRDAIVAALDDAGCHYHVHFVSGIGLPSQFEGSGLLLVSRYKIVDVDYRRFSVNGQPHKFLHFDYQVGKGVGLARIETEQGMVDVYVTHLISQYNDAPNDEYHIHRLVQAFEVAHFIRQTRKSPLAILLGDLNANPSKKAYQIITALTGMKDAYSTTAAETMRSIHDPTFGGSNVFASKSHPFITNQECDVNQRLDYVLYSMSGDTGHERSCFECAPSTWVGGRTTWQLRSAGLDFTETFVAGNGERVHCSDHYAVRAEFVPQGSRAHSSGAALLPAVVPAFNSTPAVNAAELGVISAPKSVTGTPNRMVPAPSPLAALPRAAAAVTTAVEALPADTRPSAATPALTGGGGAVDAIITDGVALPALALTPASCSASSSSLSTPAAAAQPAAVALQPSSHCLCAQQTELLEYCWHNLEDGLNKSTALRLLQLQRVAGLLLIALVTAVCAWWYEGTATVPTRLGVVVLLNIICSVASVVVVLVVFQVQQPRLCIALVVSVLTIALPLIGMCAYHSGVIGCFYSVGIGCIPVAALQTIMSYAVTTQEIRGFRFVLTILNTLLHASKCSHWKKL